MRKIILGLAACLLSSGAYAYTLSTPTVWTEDFVEMSADNDYPSSDWITYGNGAEVPDIEKSIFPDTKNGPFFVIYDQGSKSMAMATTDFVDSTPADQWLISPEVEIPYEDMTLALDICTYTAKQALGNPSLATYGTHPFKIMISETGGVEKDNFKDIYSGSVKNQASENIESVERIFNVNGYKGKKVRFAFVVTGSNIGMTGFTNIRLGQYTFYVKDDLNPLFAEVGKPVTIDFNTALKAPVPTSYLNCDVYINDQKVKEESFKKAFGVTSSYKAAIQRLTLVDVYTPTTDATLSYKLVLTPDFEGAIPTIIEGGIVFQKYKYPSNVVCEEMTGTQCGWCPRGLAALEYYHDTYKGSETEGKVINIGIHSSALGTDPMASGVERYLTSLAEVNGAAGLPGAVFNRSSQAKDPTCASEVDRQLAIQSDNFAKIVNVEIPEGDAIGQNMKVTVEVKNGYDAQKNRISLAVVLLENNIQQNSSLYNQKNYLNTYPSGRDFYNSLLTNGYPGVPEGMIPYFDKFTSTGEFNTDPIPYSKMVYQHVARGIYPSFAGEMLSPVWTADVAQTYTIEFTIPDNVLKTENLEVVALVLNNDNRGAIVASDNMGRENFTEVSGVESIENVSAVKVYNEAGALKVVAPAGSVAEVYSLDGVQLGRYAVETGTLSVDASYHGLVVVRVISDSETTTAKLLF
ncbi:MAG: Omp28-related outer membrane protein [Muribaculaceae bacterium]|nr:Omp28-related outer membrane protein [Muribaculaceae bacterium]